MSVLAGPMKQKFQLQYRPVIIISITVQISDFQVWLSTIVWNKAKIRNTLNLYHPDLILHLQGQASQYLSSRHSASVFLHWIFIFQHSINWDTFMKFLL